MSNTQRISSFENSFQLSLKNSTNYKKKLRALYTKEKPKESKLKVEWACKLQALKGLILEEYPNTVFTSDYRTILKK